AAETERARRQAAAERRAAAALPPVDEQAEETSRLAAALPRPTQPFSQSRGRLPMPVRGKIVQLYGAADGFGQMSKGIRVETLPNAQVVAPSDGSIMFAGEFRGYGLLLIISHGESYHTLLAGMSEIYGTVGQSVLAGEPVGQMGASQGERPTLYVELRRGGEPINPQPWMAANNGKVSG
ncbi:MAG: peptidoglycan DD-metalloendopeptidase family protein, partial [Alphaproteobacteria bacterium]|nr:peptidoglycan DD-metalloendopeptidase family protein [Alphaproteobacteria bacterium]